MYHTVVSIKYDLQELLTKLDRLENQRTYIFNEESINQSDEAVLFVSFIPGESTEQAIATVSSYIFKILSKITKKVQLFI